MLSNEIWSYQNYRRRDKLQLIDFKLISLNPLQLHRAEMLMTCKF